jgi:hypothetical protein
MDTPGNLKTSSSELDLDRPNIEDYLPSGSSIQEPIGKLRLYEFYLISFDSGSVFGYSLISSSVFLVFSEL